MTKIITERLSLNVLSAEDYAFIQELLNSKGWLQFIGDRNVHSKKDAIDYINKINKSQDIHYWVVRLTETYNPIGIITFMKRTYLEHFDIGFAFLPQYNNHGYAFEAAREVLYFVQLQPTHKIVLATAKPDNISSIKLLAKLGLYFVEEIEVGNETLSLYSTVSNF